MIEDDIAAKGRARYAVQNGSVAMWVLRPITSLTMWDNSGIDAQVPGSK